MEKISLIFLALVHNYLANGSNRISECEISTYLDLIDKDKYSYDKYYDGMPSEYVQKTMDFFQISYDNESLEYILNTDNILLIADLYRNIDSEYVIKSVSTKALEALHVNIGDLRTYQIDYEKTDCFVSSSNSVIASLNELERFLANENFNNVKILAINGVTNGFESNLVIQFKCNLKCNVIDFDSYIFDLAKTKA